MHPKVKHASDVECTVFRKIPRPAAVAVDSQTLRLLHDNGTLPPHHMTSRAGVMTGGMTLDDQQLMYKSAVYNSVREQQ